MQDKRPATPEGWKAHWQEQDQPWRTEPEVDEERQQFLADRRATMPDPSKDIYPFRDESGSIRLTRADVEWLLATHSHDSVKGPVDWDDETQQRREGLDLRGADLSGVSLRRLPLSRLYGGLDPSEVADFQPTYQLGAISNAALHLEGADLAGARLEASMLVGVQLDQAILVDTRLQGAYFLNASFQGAVMQGCHLEGCALMAANLDHAVAPYAHLEGADLGNARLHQADLFNAHLEGAKLDKADLSGTRLTNAHLQGATLTGAHLEGASLNGSHLGGVEMSSEDLKRIHISIPLFPAILPPANLQHCFLDRLTDLYAVDLGSSKYGFVSIADAELENARLEVVTWDRVTVLGDERTAFATTDRTQIGVRDARFEQAIRANRQLATALRTQGLSGKAADHFAYHAKLCQRELYRRQKLWAPWVVSSLGWLLAGYGYRLPRFVVIVYVGVLVLFTCIYWKLGVHSFHGESPLQAWWDSFLVSISAIHGRTTFEQLGAWSYAAWFAGIESIVGIVIEAVFVAMLIQRFFAR